MNITRFKRHISDVYFTNKSRNIEYSELAKFFFEKKSKKIFKILSKNGLDVDNFIREEFMITTFGKHFKLMMDFIDKGTIKPTDLKYVMSVDNFIDGMGDVYEKAQFLFANERPIYKHVNVDVDKMILKSIEKAKMFESQEKDKDLKIDFNKEKEVNNKENLVNNSKAINNFEIDSKEENFDVEDKDSTQM